MPRKTIAITCAVLLALAIALAYGGELPFGAAGAWLDRWQTLLSGALSALAVGAVALFAWWRDHREIALAANRDRHRLARILTTEIAGVRSLLGAGHRNTNDLGNRLLHQKFVHLPRLPLPLPILSANARDLALFDAVTFDCIVRFHAGLQHYEDHRARLDGKASQSLIGLAGPGEEHLRDFGHWVEKALAIARGVEARLSAIAEGREPSPWTLTWANWPVKARGHVGGKLDAIIGNPSGTPG